MHALYLRNLKQNSISSNYHHTFHLHVIFIILSSLEMYLHHLLNEIGDQCKHVCVYIYDVTHMNSVTKVTLAAH